MIIAGLVDKVKSGGEGVIDDGAGDAKTVLCTIVMQLFRDTGAGLYVSE